MNKNSYIVLGFLLSDFLWRKCWFLWLKIAINKNAEIIQCNTLKNKYIYAKIICFVFIKEIVTVYYGKYIQSDILHRLNNYKLTEKLEILQRPLPFIF